MKILLTKNNYTIYDTKNFDTENSSGTKKGYIEIHNGYYYIVGNLPKHIQTTLHKIAACNNLKKMEASK